MASSVLAAKSRFLSGGIAIEGNSSGVGTSRSPSRRVVVRATAEKCTSSRRGAMLGLAAASLLVASQQAKAASDIQVFGPPPPSGGLPGTENSDQPRDLDLPLKDRFYLQPQTPEQAVSRIKDAAKDIVGVKDLIDKKSWPYVRNDLRSRATYLRYDLQTITSSKPKSEAKEIKKLSKKFFEMLETLDLAARMKDPSAAEKSYNDTVAALNEVIAKIG